MRPQGRLPGSGALALAGLFTLGVTVGSVGCAPECWDDGLFQGGCPQLDSESASGTSGADSSSTATTELMTGSGGNDDSVMTADGSSGGSSGGPVECPGLDEDLQLPLRTFHFAVEQSDAMTVAFDGSPRWDAVEDALVHPVLGAVTQQQSTARFGLSSYRGAQVGCPQLITVPPQLDAADEITVAMGMAVVGGSNPVADAIDDVVVELDGDAWMGDKVIVLLTGGEPTTCAIPAPANAIQLSQTRDAAVAAVGDAFDAGYPTVVVSVGDDIGEDYLQELANAGGGHQVGDPDVPFFVVHDDPELDMAIEEILDLDRPCSFTLGAALPDDLLPGCTVEVNGMAVAYDDPDGWTRPDEQTLELQGGACDAIQVGDATVEMVCSCDDL
ncbi:vWA domain-containing protein [Paraliomyxa miuraensis]|uniref:hypothetical protein n=1 Tax=Paraliomyxa miuraensis TaxID=376150 RepID=UPI002253D635|nr:hypothetical protein [Paraliomyxa miuraensis]MCX4245392.1 hypothetical protein [Paraliomyxa miuraensis]